MSEDYGNRTRINPRIDKNLVDLMKTHVCGLTGISQQDWIAEAIAEKLGVPLNPNHMLDEEYYINLEIQKLENCIERLTEKKKRLEENQK
ncbi:hypothetical protein [Methanobrevibacter sp. V14]|uniref:hypothetical protein n=1 Tax=Methanobrevibacter sp. V14 TaxID=3064280 RepID=UPI0027359FCA|nr:hypothetical protein [Methanobrevibacter sp. V14]